MTSRGMTPNTNETDKLARIRNFKNFLRLLRGMPPDPARVSDTGAKQVREAMHVSRGGSGLNKNTDKLFGKAIASGHQEKPYGGPCLETPRGRERRTQGQITPTRTGSAC